MNFSSLALMVFALLSCSGGENSSSGQDGATNSVSVDSNLVSNAEPFSDATQRVIPYLPEAPYEVAHEITLANKVLRVDFLSLRAGLRVLGGEARSKHSKATGLVCVEGCSDDSNLFLLPALQALYPEEQSRHVFQIIRSRTKLSDGSLSYSTDPDEWTKRGWEEFETDLLFKLGTDLSAITDETGDAICNEKVIALLKK
jgi:hypothetical protein